MISKELLRSVFNIDQVFKLKQVYNNIEWEGEACTVEINIYELAHKCKVWANTRGFHILSGKPIVMDDFGEPIFNYWYHVYLCDITNHERLYRDNFASGTEPEAIFKACEWILEQMGDSNEA